MAAKSFSNRFPLRKLNRKRDHKRRPLTPPPPHKAGRGKQGTSRRP